MLELYDLEVHQKISKPNHQKLKTMVKRSIDQKLRLRNFDARNERMERGAVVTSRGSGRVVLKEDQENALNGRQKDSVREERSVGLRESQAIIQELTSQVQELQDRVNLMDGSAEESEGSSSTSRQDSSPYDGGARNHFWSFSGTAYTVITLNRESNCTCRERSHPHFHYDTLT